MDSKAPTRLKRASGLLRGVSITFALLCLMGNPAPLPVQTANLRDVVINEVAWMGTVASSYDEWIELYNNTDHDIDLTGWKLEAADGTPSITLSGTILAKGYFFLERTDDNTVRDILADQVYGNDGPGWALSNTGEALFLKDPTGSIIDTANGDGGGWPAGLNDTSVSPPDRRTMERIDPLAPDSDGNWCTNDSIHRNGLDAGGKPINGTPKARNSCTNKPPIADAGPDQTVKVGSIVQLDGSGSSDPDGDPLSYNWSLVSKPAGSAAALSNPDIVDPTFIADLTGEYVLELTVDDGRGGRDSDRVKITAVANALPVADFYTPALPTTCQVIQFVDSSYDPDGKIISWQWAFGDGVSSSEPNPEHRYSEPGVYTVALTVTDDDGASATASKGLEVSLEEGDVDNDCARTVKDAILAAKAALGLLALTKYQGKAADVVPPCEAIDVRDVVRIAEVALEIKDEGIFTCSGGSGQSLRKAIALNTHGSKTTQLRIGSKEILPGERTTIRISASTALMGLQVGPQGALSFDPKVIQVWAIRGVLPFQVLASEIDNEVGRAKLMAITLEGPRSGEVIEIEVEAIGQPGESTLIKLTPDMALDAQGEEARAGPARGRLTVGKAVPLEVRQVLSIPNPVRSRDSTRFAVEGQGVKEIQVWVYDLSGREVFASGWVRGATFEWDLLNRRGEAVANGIYLYTISVCGFGKGEFFRSGLKKLVVLK